MSIPSMWMNQEEVYFNEPDDQEVQERQRYEEQVARMDPDTILAILADEILHNPQNAIHAWVVQTIALADVRPYMSQAESHQIGQEIAQGTVTAMRDQVAMQRAVGS